MDQGPWMDGPCVDRRFPTYVLASTWYAQHFIGQSSSLERGKERKEGIILQPNRSSLSDKFITRLSFAMPYFYLKTKFGIRDFCYT